MISEFKSLSHARSVRDKLAEWAKADIEESSLEKICRAEVGWKKALTQAKVTAQERWNGSGIPNWDYLDDLAEAISFIAKTERETLNLKLRQQT